jgi:PKD repeat protein
MKLPLNRRLYSLFTYALFFACMSLQTLAQTPQFFSSGTGSNNSFPFNTTTSNKVQWIYIPSEFPGATSGVITKVYFKSATTGTNKNFTNLTIKMGYTAAANTVTGPFQTTGLTTVYFEPTLNIPTTTNGGWVEFALQTPFYYDNTQNLLVEASTTAFSGGFSIVQNSANGIKRLYGNVTSPTGTANTGLANLGFDILAYQDNAGMGGIIAPAANICFGSHEVRVQLKNKGSNAINNVNINWMVNNVLQPPVSYTTSLPIAQTADVSLGNFNFPVNKPQTIVAWTTDPNGNTDPENSDDTVTLVRTAVDKPNGFVIAAGSDQICPGDSVLLYALTGNGNINYQWQFNANAIPGATQSSIYAKAGGFYSVAMDNGACDAQSNFKEIIIAPPIINLGIDSEMCESFNPYTLDPKLANAISYQWSTGAVTPTIDVTQSGTYWVEVTKTPGCITTDTVTLTFDPLPKVAGISYLQTGNSYTFEPGGLQYAASYFWDFGDGNTSTDLKPVHTYAVEQTRTVMFIAFNACGTDTTFVQLKPTDINKVITSGYGVRVYPNPAQNTLYIDMASPAPDMHLRIMNAMGQVVFEKLLEDQFQNKVDISSLPAGSYILKVNDYDRMVTWRFNVLK